MQELLRWLEVWLRNQRDVVSCLVMAIMTLPMLIIFLLLPWIAFGSSQWRTLYDWNNVVPVQISILLSASLLSLIATYCWLHRFSEREMPMLSAVTVSVCMVAMAVLNISYGYKDSPLILFGLGLMILVRGVFKPKIYRPMVLVLVALFVVCEVGLWSGTFTYAPLLKTPIFSGDELLPWWSFWLRVIFILIVMPMAALFFVLGYFMNKEKLALEHLATTDALTDIANRSNFMTKLDLEGRRHARKDLPMCILMCDVDNFKRVNDTWGHAMGDEVLRAIGKILNQSVRTHHDVAARVGGEEFAVLLTNMQLPQAKRIAEKIRRHLSHHIFGQAEESFQVTISIGVAQVDNGDGARGLKLADDYLYNAKAEGRNRVAAMELVSRVPFLKEKTVE